MASKPVQFLGKTTAIVGLLAVLWGLWVGLDKYFFSNAKIEILSATVKGSSIDLQLQNSGRANTIVFKATFSITAHTFSQNAPSLLAPSASYLVSFPIELQPTPAQPIEVPLSQEIKVGEPDRILLTLGVPRTDKIELRGLHHYTTTIDLYYGPPTRKVTSAPLTISLISASGPTKSTADILKGLKGGKGAAFEEREAQ